MLPYSNVITKIYDKKDTVAGQYNDCLENFLEKKRLCTIYTGLGNCYSLSMIYLLFAVKTFYFSVFSFSFKLMMDNLFFEYKIKCQ